MFLQVNCLLRTLPGWFYSPTVAKHPALLVFSSAPVCSGKGHARTWIWPAHHLQAILAPATGKEKHPVAEGFMWRHKANPYWRPGKFPLSSLPMSEFVLKDFLSQGSTCLITAIWKTVNSWWTQQYILIEYIEHAEQKAQLLTFLMSEMLEQASVHSEPMESMEGTTHCC